MYVFNRMIGAEINNIAMFRFSFAIAAAAAAAGCVFAGGFEYS